MMEGAPPLGRQVTEATMGDGADEMEPRTLDGEEEGNWEDDRKDITEYGTKRYTGTVRRFMREKGYGFVEDHNCEEVGKESSIFFHQSQLDTGDDYWAYPCAVNNTKVSFVLSTFRDRQQAGKIQHEDGSKFAPAKYNPVDGVAADKVFTGTVSRYFRWFGFIKPDAAPSALGDQEDIYFHKSDLIMQQDIPAYINDGARVSFCIAQDNRGKICAAVVQSESGTPLQRPPRSERSRTSRRNSRRNNDDSGNTKASPRRRRANSGRRRIDTTRLSKTMNNVTTTEQWGDVLSNLDDGAKKALMAAIESHK